MPKRLAMSVGSMRIMLILVRVFIVTLMLFEMTDEYELLMLWIMLR